MFPPIVRLLRMRDEVLHIAARSAAPDVDDVLAAIRDRFHHTLPAQRPYVLLDILKGPDVAEHEARTLRRNLLEVAVDLVWPESVAGSMGAALRPAGSGQAAGPRAKSCQIRGPADALDGR